VFELAERGEAVARVAVLVDVQDIGAGPAGGDREVGGGLLPPPGPDPVRAGGGVALSRGPGRQSARPGLCST
jgi:hypothetical protein